MTTSQDQPPVATPPAPPGRAATLPSVRTISDWCKATVTHVGSWLQHHRDEATLIVPATLYLCLVCLLVFEEPGLLIALGGSALLARLGTHVSAGTLLTLYRAQPIAPRQGTGLRAAVSTLAERAGLTHQPAIAIIPSMAVGVFSAGHGDRTAILLTEGLLRRFSLREIVAITAHEIAHIKAGDLSYFSLADAMTRVAQILAYLGGLLFLIGGAGWLLGEPLLEWWPIALLILAPALNSQLQLAMPRDREYAADRLAATLLGDPAQIAAIALALEPDFGSPMDDFRLPVPQRRSPIPSPVRAHLAGSARAERLRAAPLSALLPLLAVADEPLVSLVGVGPIEMRPRDRWPGLWF